MKKNLIFIRYAVVLSGLISLLSFKTTKVGSGSIYCNSSCSASTRIDFRICPGGVITDPCDNGPGGEYNLCDVNSCVAVTGPFCATAAGK